MLSNSIVIELKNLLSEGKLETAFALLKNHLHLLPDDFIILESRFSQIKHNLALGLIDFGEFSLLFNQCINSFLNFLKIYEKPDIFNSTLKFSPHHQYTCDRVEQYKYLTLLINNTNRPRQHFFYLYGGESHAHNGIFKRFVNRLKGVEWATGFEVRDFRIPIPCIEDINCLGIELSRIILSQMEITDKDMEQMSEKNLAFGLAKSPNLSKLGKEEGKILFHFSITETLWNARIVPELTHKFIQNFCLKNLPPDAPELFFFFSVEYDDDNQTIQHEIETALGNAEFLKNLGELKMVENDHIEEWFKYYKDHWETVSERKTTKSKYFGEKTPNMYMEQVQTKLKRVINEINEQEKYGTRN